MWDGGHRQASILPNKKVMWLRFKIFVGYITLITLLAFTVYSFRKEQMERNRLRQDERELIHTRHLAEQIYAALLELSALGETVGVWKEADLSTYQRKSKEACQHLQGLKPYIHSTKGLSRVDSLCILLEQKEQLLDTVMRTFIRLQEVGEIVNRKIPVIVSHVQKTTESLSESAPKDTVRKSSGPTSFWSRLLGRKEKQSAYLEQRKKQKEISDRKRQKTSATGILRSLNREVTKRQRDEREKLLFQMDELYDKSIKQNQRLHSILKELETEANLRIENRYRQFVAEHDRSFHTLSIVAISVSLLALLLYGLVHRDLKRKYRYQRRLESSNTEKQELLQSRKDMMLSIAHDLRSPLATISGSAELLPKESGEQGRMRYVDNIRTPRNTCSRWSTRSWSSTCSTAASCNIIPPSFTWAPCSGRQPDSHAPAAKKKHLGFSTGFSGLDVVVGGEKGFLQQVVNNLLSNAIKFTEEGSVRLEAEYRKGELRLLVQDTGIGMDVKDASRIFDPFERLENGRHASGFGLGLAITSRLVSEMGGKIDVESTPGRGSRFTVLVPLPPADGNSLMENRRPLR